jgi:glycosyltransferase involved in cell wall biosynthesis
MNQSDFPSGVHILLIHQAFASLDEPGGTRHYEMAKSFVAHGNRVTVITSPVSYLTGKTGDGKSHWLTHEEPEPGLHILRTYTYPALHRSFFHRLLGFITFMFSSFLVGLSVKYVDVVWGTSPPIFQGWTAWLLARLKRVKFLFEVRDLWPAFAIAMKVLRNPILIHLSNWLERFLYRHADMLVVNSPGFIDHVAKRGGTNIKLIPNGVDPEMFDPDRDGKAFREKYNLCDAYLVLYAGAHGVSNDLEVVLDAASITAKDPRIVYLFVGDGKEKNNLQQKSEFMQLSNVRFLPPVPKDEMGDVLAAADSCIAILKPIEMYKTTYPNKVFDYMAAGRPVLCAIDGVIREVVETAGAGIFVPPGDSQALANAVFYLSNHAAEGRQMGNHGRTYVIEKFNRKRISSDMENDLLMLAKNSFSRQS